MTFFYVDNVFIPFLTIIPLPRKAISYFQGRIVIANVSSISLTTFFLVVLYNVKGGQELDITNESSDIQNDEFFVSISHTTCQALGYSLYCVGISMFCWMSVMCFDLFWTFARTTIPRYGNYFYFLK